jgi:undecaprenyl diphosphate synthase
MTETISVPYHVGIIMDGNGRWASEQGLPRFIGHQKGAEVVKDIVQGAANIGVKALTLFGFSEENWNRPQDEVSVLMELAESYLKRELNNLHKEHIRFQVIGNKDKLPQSLQKIIRESEEITRQNDRFFLNVALSYSGRWDIVQAFKRLLNTTSDPDLITEDLVSQHLSLQGLPDPDLIIRTSGEQRISNFLLWQSAYAELYFSPTLWPDFTKADLEAAVTAYQARQRRFGKL